jgi:hypothetical protein
LGDHFHASPINGKEVQPFASNQFGPGLPVRLRGLPGLSKIIFDIRWWIVFLTRVRK